MSNAENIRLMNQWAAHNSAHDCEALLGLFTDEFVYDDLPLGVVATTRAELKTLIDDTFNSIPDWKMTIVSAFADDERGAAEWVMTGAMTGEFPGLPSTGKSFSVRGASVARFAGGRISHWTDYWSLSALKEQLEA
jgi:steroid delta-isomerase-like uncharacterized protein